jgi:hypothetical protein
MKYHYLLAITILLNVSIAFSSNLRRDHKNIVIDRSTTGVELTHVVRRNPTITATHQYGLPSGSAPSSTLSFGANNDDNGPNLGGFGKNAAIASKMLINLRSFHLLPRQRRSFCYSRNSGSRWVQTRIQLYHICQQSHRQGRATRY